MAEEKYPINIWINEDRFAKLQKAGLADLPEEMLAGLKVPSESMPMTRQKDKILKTFPTAKFEQRNHEETSSCFPKT